MPNNISKEEIHQAVAKVRHPEIDRTLVELGMIKNITLEDDKVMLSMALPFLGVPIKDYLVWSVEEVVTKLGLEIEVELTEMNQEERDAFMTMAREGWIG
jgi:ATP-binding protein involved in chromosome partitioning